MKTTAKQRELWRNNPDWQKGPNKLWRDVLDDLDEVFEVLKGLEAADMLACPDAEGPNYFPCGVCLCCEAKNVLEKK